MDEMILCRIAWIGLLWFHKYEQTAKNIKKYHKTLKFDTEYAIIIIKFLYQLVFRRGENNE